MKRIISSCVLISILFSSKTTMANISGSEGDSLWRGSLPHYPVKRIKHQFRNTNSIYNTKTTSFIDYLPLTAGSSYPLTGTLYGTQANFSGISSQSLYMLKGSGGAAVTLTGNNYGFAIEQPADQPLIQLRRDDVHTNILQTWDGSGNSTLSGNLGIGTNATSDRLTVNGNIVAKKIKLTQLGWSDYVFGKDYQLRSLYSLENYILENKRLPEIPSAKDVEENGISVGETQALLLSKIEELTLYIIAQQKEIDQLKKLVGKK